MSGRVWVGIGLAVTLVMGACTGGAGGSTEGRSREIPQPVVESSGLAPDSERVDLAVPTFSHPTDVTNPLFPVSKQASVLFVGHVDNKPFRTEVTLLPDTRTVEWEGQRIETLVSQYMAYLDGRIQEVAYDLYAQADDGSVWYFGEDVADFEHGVIVTKEGTWIVGKDGPAAMIMPARPRPGDAYRTENIPGVAFEQVTVGSVDRTIRGPLGPIHGAMIAKEFHLAGETSEDKVFAPGYGEFRTYGAGDLEALALAVPTDTASGPVPRDLDTLSTGASDIFDAAGSGDWNSASTTLRRMSAAWMGYRRGDVPWRIAPRLTEALHSLGRAVAARDAAATRQAAIAARQWSLDIELRYRPATEINLSRFDLWAAQLEVDAAARDRADVNGDAFTLEYIRDRILRALGPADHAHLDLQLEALQTAVGDRDLAAASRAAERLRGIIKAS